MNKIRFTEKFSYPKKGHRMPWIAKLTYDKSTEKFLYDFGYFKENIASIEGKERRSGELILENVSEGDFYVYGQIIDEKKYVNGSRVYIKDGLAICGPLYTYERVKKEAENKAFNGYCERCG